MEEIIQQQRDYFKSNATLPLSFRIKQLQKLKRAIITYENDISKAIQKDLNKAPAETIINEIAIVIKEIDFVIKHLSGWAKPKRVRTPFPMLWPGSSHIYSEPYGCILIIAPWNYPFLLLMSPLIGAISAGNCVLLKPSELAPQIEAVLIRLIADTFAPEYISAISADANQTNQLLEHQFDYIFFTGSTHIGKLVMQAAAKHLTPVTLELGGKSPCIVDETANLDFAARRIIWSKMTNAGQVCIAPDYLYVQRSCKQNLIEKLKTAIQNFYGDNISANDQYGRIINDKHMHRLVSLVDKEKIIVGGDVNSSARYLQPTLIDNVEWDDRIMQQEIFGPVLPIITFDSFDEVIAQLRAQPKPLALYLFSMNKQHEQKILQQVSFGGGCINDCLMQIANPHLPFGGVGASGMGRYHGKFSFETFSHSKSIYKKTWLLDLKLEYPPYTKTKLKWIRRIINWSW